jgi:hypothetical protein
MYTTRFNNTMSKNETLKLTQQQVFQDIRSEFVRSESRGEDLTKAQIVAALKKLYDPNCLGPRYFYLQNVSGMPIAKVHSIVDGAEISAQLLTRTNSHLQTGVT